ncbi:hypothetical protein ACLI09_14955 [Flavobacterium sp. RHBU_24]|uniref:hypothetical protein n=1 Tax=Flavobacterium sp. RHBU_24 TaxID=3391185 RepID=UPI0039847ADD
MKKALLLVLLVPFFALSQGTLATWNVSDWPYPLTPSNVASGLTATSLTGNNITFPTTGDSNGVATYGWPTTGNFDDTKYVQFAISTTAGFSVTSVNFQYRGDARKHRIQYSTDNFATTLGNTYNNSVNNNPENEWSTYSNNQTFSTPLVVAAGKTLKVRIYAGHGNSRFIKNITVSGTLNTTPLNGTYVIGATQQSTYPQFATITSAIAYLNSYGVSGPVTFLFKDPTYTAATETFPLTINSFPGSSATNTVTFKPAPGVNTSINAAVTLLPAVFKINGADNIIFDGSNATNGTTRNLTIYNQDQQPSGGDANRAVVWIASNGNDPATNITVKYAKIDMFKKNADYNFCAGIFVGNNTVVTEDATASAANNKISILNNDFWNVKQAVFINGGNTPTTNVTINGNDMGEAINAETILQGIKLKNVTIFTVSGNYIHNIYRNSTGGSLKSSAIYVDQNTTYGTIERNNIVDVVKVVNEGNLFAGILLSSTANASNILIKNNFVRDVRGYNAGNTYMAGGYGIWVHTGGGYKIYNNTVLQNKLQDGSGNGYSAALFVEAATNLDVRNNIFVNTQTASAPTQSFGVLLKLENTSGFTNLDHNNIYGEYIGYLGTNPDGNPFNQYQTSISGWASTTGKEQGSVNINPVFVSATNLHINENDSANAPLDGTATVLNSVTKDIDGQVRNTTNPDMGADEFGALGFPTGGGTAGVYCDSSTTWNGTSWNNGNPDATKDAIFAAGNFTQNGGTFSACSMYVLNGASVNFGGNSEITVTHSVNIQTTGSLTVESGSNLVQIEDDINSGIATIKRNSSRLKRLDYTLWCAPVLDSRATGYQTLRQFSMATSNGRFYDYHTETSNYWPLPELTAKFELLRSVLIRMPNADATPGYNTGGARIIFPGVFVGTPNTGTIRKTLEYYSAANAFNAVGNPYPSPLSVTDFINANINSINGTIWLWRKTNDASQSSYATVNLGGYVANAAPGGSAQDGNDLIQDPYTINTKGSLNTAQGFFVKATAADKELVYRNNMRLETHSPSFFRSATAEPTGEEAEGAPHFDRVWLNITNDNNLFAQALIGYNNQSSIGYENGYDGEMLSTSVLNLYTVMHTETDTLNLAIQTRGNFVITDQVALGFSASAAGTYTINLDHADGAFANGQKVYIKDNAEGITRELTANNYTFTTEAGQFNDRFTVLYTTATQEELGTEPVVAINKEVMVYNAGGQVKAVAPENIKSVVVYDITGKVLYQDAAVNNVEFSSSVLNALHQVVIVTVTLDSQKVVTKKLMIL